MKKKNKLRYRNPFIFIFAVPCYVIVWFGGFILFIIDSLYKAFKITQSLCVIEEDEPIVAKEWNDFVEREMKFKMNKKGGKK